MTFDELKKEKAEVYFVDYYDLQNFIAANLGIDYIDINELKNDTDYTYFVNHETSFDKWDTKIIEEAKSLKIIDEYGMHIILNYLCGKGIIPEKTQIVMQVSW